ncbi:hypothetical protein [Pelagibacterium halotolerans]|uniref:hypothetical protein n=1 Tax=Pelagibacterium halotolerans TaxID=531813 RepID=UPI00384B2A50
MRPTLLIVPVLAALFAGPAIAQSDGDTAAPVPPPRPPEFGGEPLTGEGGPDAYQPPLSELGTEETGPFSQAIANITEPQPVTLSARISDDGPLIPDGLVWRVFDSRVDASGELAMVAKSEEATASFTLPPGEYVLHLAYGRAQASDTLFVEPGPNNHTMTFEVGGLQLDAMISGDVDIPDALLRFDIYSTGPNGRVEVAQNVAPGELVRLNAGIYTIESHFGGVNAVIRTEIRVEPGQITEATLYHHAAQVSLKLVSEEGGEAIADVEWTIKSQDGDTIFTDIGAFPATVLAEGDYLAFAKLGDNVYNREFEVTPGGPREVEILTSVY